MNPVAFVITIVLIVAAMCACSFALGVIYQILKDLKRHLPNPPKKGDPE